MTETSLPTCQSRSWDPRPPLTGCAGSLGLSAVQRAQRRTGTSRGRAHALTLRPGAQELPTARANVGVGVLGLSYE